MRIRQSSTTTGWKNNEIPVYDGPDSLQRAALGRTIEYEWEGEEKMSYVNWPKEYQRYWKPMLDPDTGKVLSDAEIQLLLDSVKGGFKADRFENTDHFLKFLKYRNQVEERVYGMMDSDISVCRFFTSANAGNSKAENILSDIRAINEKENMGNVKIPDTNIEIINYSPCPKCNAIHSFSDVFNYYMNPTPDPRFKSRAEQYATDTRVQCKECKAYFLPALIVTDGSPKNECQMICRSQTIREVAVFMQTDFKLKTLYLKKENVLECPADKSKRAWRNDVDAKLLKKKPGLFTNFLQYTPANNILNFITRRNLQLEEPLYGAWLPETAVRYYE